MAILGSRGLFDHRKEPALVGGVHHDCWTSQRKRKQWWIRGPESVVVSTGLAVAGQRSLCKMLSRIGGAGEVIVLFA